jgi:hypothetical protein
MLYCVGLSLLCNDVIYKNPNKEDEDTMAEEGKCPPATQDVAVNIKNRQNAIKSAAYGPLNPKEPNDAYWNKKAKRWDVSVPEAKKQKCGNCIMFVRTPTMLNCIEGGLGNEEGNVAWDIIKAGELGYCEAFDFKCAASRTCDAWVVGGPTVDEGKLKEKSLEIDFIKLQHTRVISVEIKDDLRDIEMPEWGDDYSDEALFGDGSVSTKSAKLKDPKGGLTAAGRKFFNRTQGANLKPGVKGAADTPEKMKRKGSFLTRFFTNPSGPMVDEKGRATRLALSAAAWGEKVPKNAEDAAALAAKGRRLLERYENTKNNKKSEFFENVETKSKKKPFWEQDSPSKGKSSKLTDGQKRKAKARAKAAGRPYPNLVDNVWAAKQKP